MKPPPLRYSRPRSTAEALAALASLGERGKVLAGGQSLVPLLSMRLAAPEHLVDINRLAELCYVRVEDGQVRVGALARHAQVLADPAAAAAQPLLGLPGLGQPLLIHLANSSEVLGTTPMTAAPGHLRRPISPPIRPEAAGHGRLSHAGALSYVGR